MMLSVRGVLAAAACSVAAGDLIMPAPALLCAQGEDCGGQVWTDCGSACPEVCGAETAMMCTMNCVAEYQCPAGVCFSDVSGACEAVVVGPCAQAVAGAAGGIGAFVPQCTASGAYEPLQMHGSTGYSWCVDDQGNELTTPVGPGDAAGETPESCATIRLQGQATPAPAPTDLVVAPPASLLAGGQLDGDDETEAEEEKLGLVFVLSLLTLFVLPVVLYCVFKKACEKDEAGARTSLVGEDSSNRESKEEMGDEEGGGGGEDGEAGGKGEMTPLSRSSGQ